MSLLHGSIRKPRETCRNPLKLGLRAPSSGHRCGLPGQEPPGWDLSEAGLQTLFEDLGLATAEDYIRYKAETSVRRTQSPNAKL